MALIEPMKKADDIQEDAEDRLALLQERRPETQIRLWRSYRPVLMPIARSILRSSTEAENLVDEVLCDFLFHYVANLHEPRAIGAYLKSMTVRRACRLRDKLQRQTSFEEEEIPGVPGDAEPERRILSRWLEKCLRRLTAKARTILRLHYGHDLSYREIGQQLGRTRQAVGISVQKSRKALQKCLEKQRRDAVRRRSHAI